MKVGIHFEQALRRLYKSGMCSQHPTPTPILGDWILARLHQTPHASFHLGKLPFGEIETALDSFFPIPYKERGRGFIGEVLWRPKAGNLSSLHTTWLVTPTVSSPGELNVNQGLFSLLSTPYWRVLTSCNGHLWPHDFTSYVGSLLPRIFMSHFFIIKAKMCKQVRVQDVINQNNL